MTLAYQSGFGNEFATEALPGTLPQGRNSPQRVTHGLYAEQLSGTAFTAPRHSNRRTWFYRIRPAALHGAFELLPETGFHNRFAELPADPNQLRWSPLPEIDTDHESPEVAEDGVSVRYPGGYVHLPKVDAEYLQQLCAEQLITRRNRNGFPIREWQKIRERNEALDCYVYARAAASAAGLDRFEERHWRELERQLGVNSVEKLVPKR